MVTIWANSEINGQLYIDIIFLINLIMDFFILWATAKVGRIQTKGWRLFIAALVGACYSLVVLLPQWQITTTFSAKLICSIIMVIVAFFPFSIRNIFKSLMYFYLISFVMGGAVMGLIYLTNQSPVYSQAWNGAAVILADISYQWLIVGLLIAIMLAFYVAKYIRRNWQKSALQNPVTVSINNSTITVNGFLDTGNQLYDPISRKPVIIVESSVFNKLIPDFIREMVEKNNGVYLQKDFSQLNEEWRAKLQLIPFSSIGKNNGLLLAIRPDWVEVSYGTDVFRTSQALVGLYSKKLSPDGIYQALLHPDLLDQMSIKT